MDTKPELKQVGDWYEESDEEAFRPWTGELPADAPAGMLLVNATFELKDGSTIRGS
jgi:hypothetical protein